MGNPCVKCGRSASVHKVSHRSAGDPCNECNLPASQHRPRPEHTPLGDPCIKCGAPWGDHRPDRTRNRKAGHAEREHYIGIDGEGMGREDHHYIFLGACSENGERYSVSPERGAFHLTTVQCLDMILDLPGQAKIFSYAFGYDLTKILADCDNTTLYNLWRPEERKEGLFGMPKPVTWGDYRLNLQGTKFSVESTIDGRRRVIWDLFKFFQGKFVDSLKKWKVGDEALWERMGGMKNDRSEFETRLKEKGAAYLREIEEYCYEECFCMAQLARKLIEAHNEADLTLKTYYGAGSSGAAMLETMGIKEKNVPIPEPLKEAVACSFFGGRFEHSFIGSVKRKVYTRDISSAYPYQTYHLPCLQHGEWTLVKKRENIDSYNVALVNYEFDPSKPRNPFWGPFPFRTAEGCIAFPNISGGGWVWQDEYKQGERLFPNVRFKQAWCWKQSCRHKPFAKIPEYYLLRLKYGKEGAGIVIKLAINSCYGKLAQSVGNAVYNNWIWASLITSGTRAQLLEALGLHDDWSKVLMFATDSIASLEEIVMPVPKITGTEHTGKPLGGWEEKNYDRGIFLARPGIYFPLAPDRSEMDQIKARGIGRGVLLDNWERIIHSFETNGPNVPVTIGNIDRFCGGKTSISRNGDGYCTRASGGIGDKGQQLPAYGQWVRRQLEMSFDPMPKRSRVNPDGSLTVRQFPTSLKSVPYRKAQRKMSADALILKMTHDIMMEQPDIDVYISEEEMCDE